MVDVLILNYNDANTSIECAKRMENADIIRKILIVDNNSTDDSLSTLRKITSQKIETLSVDSNGGYGAGNNKGIRYLVEKYNSEYILLCNPDTIIENKVIEDLEFFLKKNRDYAIVAPFMCDCNEKKQLNTAFRIPSPIDYIMSFEILWSKYISHTFYRDILNTTTEVKDVDCVSGSLFMMDAFKMMNYGMYDEKIFLYCEELSLGMRLKKNGLKTALLPQKYFIHNHSVTISKTYKREFQRHKLLIRSKLYIIKNYYNAKFYMRCLAYVLSGISIIEICMWSTIHEAKKKRLQYGR